ncbi:MAG: nucleotidyltransferase domain-containing protein [Clostridia bacterium]|nr:nucleotidyltransferase domain-containing protein [Clostridia bacterium]
MKEDSLEIKEKKRVYKRNTAKSALENVKKKIKEANENNEFIYYVSKAVLFGSYINSDRKEIGDIDIALYIELKDKYTPEIEQNIQRSLLSCKQVPFLLRYIYGKEEIAKFIKDKKSVIHLHDGNEADKIAREYSKSGNYIYNDKYELIYCK